MRRILTALLLLALSLTGCALPQAGRYANPTAMLLSETADAVTKGEFPDFAKLKEQNPDIIAWLYIPAANVNDPVLRREDDDAYYAKHAADGEQSSFGALYVEAQYNSEDFTDPVTVVYGSSDAQERLFSNLQWTFSPGGSLQNEITLYTPEITKTYKPIAASAFNANHIMSTHMNFKNRQNIPFFLDELKSYHTMTHQFDPSVTPTAEDDVLLLSTHLLENEAQRFLLMAIPA